MSAQPHSVLIVGGGLLTGREDSLRLAARKWLAQWRSAHSAWLDLKVKLLAAEPVAAARLERRFLRFHAPELGHEVEAFFSARSARSARSAPNDAPPLTEVVLMTLLHDAGLPYDLLSLDTLFGSPSTAEGLLAEADCVFLSSTYLHDLSELEPILRRLSRPHNRIVVGGALAGVLHQRWEGSPEVDVLAVGYGEMLVPALAAWIRSGFQVLEPPGGGRLLRKKDTWFLYSGVPESQDLDFLRRPDFRLARQEDQPSPSMIYYESVRGCSYRCSFCNYPYLFDDKVFRYKSAAKMAHDWERYLGELDLEYITCLDSLFTVPRTRLVEFCHLLIDRRIRVKWICYARADDLADERLVVLMKRAGAHQVQIGIESGDPQLLRNMNKRCTVKSNARALVNCRKHGLTSVVSLIVGFPGETAASLERTRRFLEETPPDFYFLATFSTRVAGVPILEPDQARRFGLQVVPSLYNMAPYWRHDTMSSAEVGDHVRDLDHRLMADGVALNAILFHSGLLDYRPEQRPALLDFQRRVAVGHPVLRAGFSLLHRLVDRSLRRDLERHFEDGQVPAPGRGPSAVGPSP